MNTKIKKGIFFYGLGGNASQYKFLKDFDIAPIDWNNIKIPKTKYKVVGGFSFGGILACEYALKNKVDHLILCSMTTGVETLKKVKAQKITFIVGGKEDWVIKDIYRLTKDIKNWKIVVIPNIGHKMNKAYQKQLLYELRDKRI